MKSGGLKALGIATTIAGAILTIVNSYVDEKKRDEKVKEAVNKELNERFKCIEDNEEA